MEKTTIKAVTGDLRDLLQAASLCNNARLLPPSEETPRWSILGDPTEAALLVAAKKAQIDRDREEQILPRLRELPFESQRKRMSTLHHRPDRLPQSQRRAATDLKNWWRLSKARPRRCWRCAPRCRSTGRRSR